MLGGGFLQCFVIKKAKQLGYEVHVLDANPQAEGFKYADAYAVINIVDEEACLAYARSENVDGVLTAATDYSVLAMSRIASELHLPGINYSSAKLIKNKAEVRRCLFDAQADDTGYSYEISSSQEALSVLPEVKFPVMVKPCDGSGSRGASRVDNPDEFVTACEYAMQGSITHRAVAEPFVVGREYGVESFVNQGEIHILAVMQKDMTMPPYYAELGHAIPSGLSVEMEAKVKECVRRALIALGVNHGSVNMDLLIDSDGGVHIVDIGARMGGNLIGSHIIPLGTGIDYMANMIKAAMSDEVDFTPQTESAPVATKLLALTPGVVASLPNFDNIATTYKVTIEHHLHQGDTITPYRTNLDGCGYVVATGRDVYEAIDTARMVREIIDCTIIR
ncbi:MAG: ATP-grasp domain-containing protein [Bacteroidaceae bacterium]|nr:ATP-grasp domain-containing protein [Bacteroidaceae bacterium]